MAKSQEIIIKELAERERAGKRERQSSNWSVRCISTRRIPSAASAPSQTGRENPR